MISDHVKKVDIDSFETKDGEKIPLTLAYETYGELNDSKTNAVLICHSLTQSSHVSSHSKEDKEGWWEGMVGPNRYIDTNKYFVICVNALGSCYGSTGPSSKNPETREFYGFDFPQISIGDIVETQKLVLDELDIKSIESVIGGSIGGQQALEWSKKYPSMVKSVVPIAAGARVSPLILGFGCLSQNAIKNDPNWNGGDYYNKDEKPEIGLKIARQIGHLTYLSRESINEKFGREKIQEDDDGRSKFQIESYLNYKGDKFTDRFDPNSYLYLTNAMHRYDLSEGLNNDAEAVSDFDGLAYILSIDSDWHFTVEESNHLANVYENSRTFVAHDTIGSRYGHDAFLVEKDRVGEKIELFLKYMLEGYFE